MTANVGSPHASHFSIPEALAYTLSLPQPLPENTYFTDFTHRVEHYLTDKEFVEWAQRLRQYRGDNKEVDQDKGGPPKPFGQSERGTKGWWTDVWLEVESEDASRLVYNTAAKESNVVSVDEAQARVPDVRCGYDGQVITFTKEANHKKIKV